MNFLGVSSREEITKLQENGLKRIIDYVYNKNAIYRNKFEHVGLKPSDIKGLKDLEKLPFTTKQDLRDSYPFKMSCVTKENILRVHMSSGTTGSPVLHPYTRADIDQWSTIMARCLYAAGVRGNDVLQITPSFGLFNGGFGFHYGAERLGCMTVPAGAGNTKRQIKLIEDFGTTSLGSVASYAIRIMEIAKEEGKDFPTLKRGIFGAETFSDGLRRKIEDSLDIESYDIYGMTETGGIGCGIDCSYHDGIHIWEDHYILEIIDPKTGESLSEGEEGEVVLTSFTREALPVIRFRTGDIGSIIEDKCECGMPYRKISKIKGRVDDLLIIKGVNVYPSEIEHLLCNIPGIGNNYQIFVKENNGFHDLMIQVEGDISSIEIKKRIKENFLITPEVQVLPKGSIPRNEGKAIRIIKDKNI